ASAAGPGGGQRPPAEQRMDVVHVDHVGPEVPNRGVDLLGIEPTGQLTRERLAEVRRQAGAVLVPSRCEEACPYSVLDALGDGVPVLASDRGGLPEMVDPESVLPAEDQGAWDEALKQMWQDREARGRAGAAALDRAREQFSEHDYYNRLLEIYA
ncbi:MAG TPA: glycosyltransferase, partial [Solirubrobacteraceae bacterium]|nr:glycosyltransferase [Solirubrobacteraceae bacterium]